MDGNLFYIGTFSVLGFGLLSLIRREEYAIIYGVVGGILGMLIMTSANSDGSITVGYPQFVGDTAHTIGVWPILYLPLFFLIIAFGAALYRASKVMS